MRTALLFLFLLAGCDSYDRTSDPTSPLPRIQYRVVTIEGCEYLAYHGYCAEHFTHKGNCTNRIHLIAENQTIAWIGHPVVSDNDPYFPTQGWLPHCMVGLRSDGAVVWQLIGTNKTTL